MDAGAMSKSPAEQSSRGGGADCDCNNVNHGGAYSTWSSVKTPKCKVCVLSVFDFCVCLPCVVTCLFPCLVLVLPCSRHVLSYVCLSMPCALLLLSVSPPLTCSQSPGLCVSLVSPVSCYSPCLVHL